MERRKSNKEIIDNIVHSLSEGEKSIHEIAADTDINWESVKNYLEILKGIDFIKEKSIGKKRVFYINKLPKERDPQTLFGIPIDEEDEATINYIFMKIREIWHKKTGIFPGKTQVQKTFVDVSKSCKLNLPIVWYRFGKMCLKTYNPNEEYNFVDKKNKELELKINETVDKIKNLSIKQLKLLQYHNEKNKLYIKKEELFTLLTFGELKKTDIDKISEVLLEIVNFIPKKDDDLNKIIIKLTTEFIGTIIQILNSNDEKNIVHIKTNIISTFEGLWELIASYCFYISLRENPKYDNEGIYECLKYHFMNKIFFVREDILSLSDFIIKKENRNKGYEALKALQGSVKKELEEISKVEREEMAKGIAESNESDDLFREFGLDDS